jgi:hypothetical protein
MEEKDTLLEEQLFRENIKAIVADFKETNFNFLKGLIAVHGAGLIAALAFIGTAITWEQENRLILFFYPAVVFALGFLLASLILWAYNEFSRENLAKIHDVVFDKCLKQRPLQESDYVWLTNLNKKQIRFHWIMLYLPWLPLILLVVGLVWSFVDLWKIKTRMIEGKMIAPVINLKVEKMQIAEVIDNKEGKK